MANGWEDLPPSLAEQMATYRVKPEGMSLEQWYLQEGEITPPQSDYDQYSGPPSEWFVGQPVYLQPMASGTTDVQFEVTQPTIETQLSDYDTYAQEKMIQQGFVQGTYGGWYKPSTQETRPIPGPILKGEIDQPQPDPDNIVTNGNGNGGNGGVDLTGGSAGMLLLVALGALFFS